MNLIDTHCHLANERLAADQAGAIARARVAGLVAIICATADLEESAAAALLAGANSDVWHLAGQHPHHAAAAPADYLMQLERLLAGPRCVALGEIGLDYHYDYSPRDAQKRVFAEQLALAVRLGKPVIVHTRDAFDDTMSILRASGIEGRRVVFHSFTEAPDRARAVLDFGAMISFSGIVTFDNAAELRKTAAMAPDDRLLIETDAPFLSPNPVRRMKTNEPANVAHVAACLATVRNTTPDAIADLTTANARRFFGI